MEYGAKTGRPRRVGPIDLVATRYGVEMQGATEIALTKLDVLSYMEEIPVCVRYRVRRRGNRRFPVPDGTERREPVIETVPGWKLDISGVRRWEDLPEGGAGLCAPYRKSHRLPDHVYFCRR